MSLISVDEALKRVLAGVVPTSTEHVGLHEALWRVLSEDVPARLTHLPFDASAMDGFAVRAEDVAHPPAQLTLIGQAACGHGFAGELGPGQAVRIFTGAPMPRGADSVIIQENAEWDTAAVRVHDAAPPGHCVRRRGNDFRQGDVLLRAGERLSPRALMLAAGMNYASLPVRRAPRVAILATGDELVEPGSAPGPDQIISSVPAGLGAMVRNAGGIPSYLGIARDTREALAAHMRKSSGADILVTIGGASVGAYDLVQDVLGELGYDLAFWKIAMRPGKPLMFARASAPAWPPLAMGLPGNPVSAMICARIFLCPLLAAMLGAPERALVTIRAALTKPLETNGPRQHYLRATLSHEPSGAHTTPLPSQDSSLAATLARADALIVRPPDDPPRNAGEAVDVLRLDV
jgi:molybdopterin molybdotransferase